LIAVMLAIHQASEPRQEGRAEGDQGFPGGHLAT